MLAQIPPVLEDAAAFALAITTIGAACALVFRTRPVKWAWQRLVTEPAGQVLDDRVERAVTRVVEPRMAELRAELRPNGGQSLHDRLFSQLESLEAGQRKIFAHIDTTAGSMADAEDPDDDDLAGET